jgi:hypothetical protein
VELASGAAATALPLAPVSQRATWPLGHLPPAAASGGKSGGQSGAGAEAAASGTASATTAAGRGQPGRRPEHSCAEAEGGHAESASLTHWARNMQTRASQLGVQQWPQRRMQSAQGEHSGWIPTWGGALSGTAACLPLACQHSKKIVLSFKIMTTLLGEDMLPVPDMNTFFHLR